MQDETDLVLTPVVQPIGRPTILNVPETGLSDDLTSYSWMTIARSIVLAGIAYAVFLALIQYTFSMMFILLGQLGQPSAGLSERAMMTGMILIGSVIQAVFYAIAGMVLASVLSLVMLPIVYLVVWSLKMRGSVVWLGAFCGGLVGFLAALPIIAIAGFSVVPSASADMFWIMAMGLLIGPCLATMFGQIGGARGGYRAAQRTAAIWQVTPAATTDACMATSPLPPVNARTHTHDSTPRPRMQFRIHHLLWIMLWLSVLLTLIRLCGLPFEFILPLLAGWTVYQASTLWLGGKIVRLFRAWQLRPARST
ncbi:MAG: hypothetical protein WD468_09360 [Pirellulales bacterium]